MVSRVAGAVLVSRESRSKTKKLFSTLTLNCSVTEMPGDLPPQNEREEKEMADREREQARELRKGEKNGSGESEVERLRSEVARLQAKLEAVESEKLRFSSYERRGSIRRSVNNRGLYSAHRKSVYGSGAFREVSTALSKEEENKNIIAAQKKPDQLDDPQVEALVAKDGKLTNDSLRQLKMEDRLESDKGRAGFRMLVESKEEDAVEIIRVPNGTFFLPSLTKMQVKLKFVKQPRRVLVIKKPGDEETIAALHEVISYLSKRKVQVVLETSVQDEVKLRDTDKQPEFLVGPQIKDAQIDFIVSLGGDGTILWACGLFPEGMPPVVSFKMGSLGFLTPFPFPEHKQILGDILKRDKQVTVRARLQVTVKSQGKPPQIFTCLNEVVAKHPSKMVSLDLFSNNHKLTVVHADGLIVATPTGSTAYSLACGGSMVHPAIPAMVVTPIAPHTLSFRPIVMADSSTLRLKVPATARCEVHMSLDGRDAVVLEREDEVEITVSEYPMAAYCQDGESADWFNTIKQSFLWNVRTDQKQLN